MMHIHRDKVGMHSWSNHTCLYAESSCATTGAIIQQWWARRRQLISDQHPPPPVAHASRIFRPAQFFDRVQTRIAVRTDSQRNVRDQEFCVRSDAISEIALRGGTDTDGTTALRE